MFAPTSYDKPRRDRTYTEETIRKQTESCRAQADLMDMVAQYTKAADWRHCAQMWEDMR